MVVVAELKAKYSFLKKKAIVQALLQRTHQTYRREGSNLLVPVGIEVLLGVVDSHATIDAVRQGSVLHDRDTLVGAVGVLEEHDGGPVVGEVLGERAGRAGTSVTDVPIRNVHRRVEGISTYDLVEMGRGHYAWLDKGIEALDTQSGTAEPKVCLGRHGQPKGDRKRGNLHLDNIAARVGVNAGDAGPEMVGMWGYPETSRASRICLAFILNGNSSQPTGLAYAALPR